MSFFKQWLNSWRARRGIETARASNVGRGSYLSSRVQVYGWTRVRIGRNTVICDDTLLNAINCPGDQPAITIGDHCFIGRRNFLNAGESLLLGDYCLTGSDCHFLGSDHIYASPFMPYITAGNTMGGVSQLGPNVWLGARVTVMKGVQIGYGAIIGAASVVTRDVPPLSVAVGSPARVVKRFDIARSAWVPVEDFPLDGEARFPGESEYLANLRQTHPSVRMPVRAIGIEFGDL